MPLIESWKRETTLFVSVLALFDRMKRLGPDEFQCARDC
jgi:hypothetical protein